MSKLKILFFAISIATLLWGVLWYMAPNDYNVSDSVRAEVFMPPTQVMYVITLPASLIIQMAYTSISTQYTIDLGIEFHPVLEWIIFVWLPLVLGGYFQWFVLFKRKEPEI